MSDSIRHADTFTAATTGRATGHPHTLSPATARAILVDALLIALAGDALLRDGPLGAAFPLWIALLALNVRPLLQRADTDPTREANAWFGAAVLFALGTAWRNDDPLRGFDVLATGFSLGMAALSVAQPRAGLLGSRLRDTIVAYARVVASVATGAPRLVFRDAQLEEAFAPRGGRAPIIRPVLVAATLLVFFGALLSGADPIFASFVSLPTIDVGVALSHVVLVGFVAWITAGWVRACLLSSPDVDADAPARFQLAPRDAYVALGTLDVLFAAFVAVQIGWLFGGEAYLRARTGLTVADYARRGFFQMVWVVALVVPILVITRTALPQDRTIRRRHTAFALPLIALLGAIVLSALFRLKLYAHFYGLTIDRFYALAFMAWLVVVVAWLAATVLRDWHRPFAAGAIVSALVMLATLNAIDPDTIVARVNVARAERIGAATADAPTLDVRHLATLGGGAVPIAVRAVRDPSPLPAGSAARVADDAQRCAAVHVLLKRWGPSSRLAQRQANVAAWRSWNAADAAALRTVAANAAALRSVAHQTCAAAQR